MKRIITILLILSSWDALSQPFVTRSTGAIIPVDVKLKASASFYMPVASDTTLNGSPDSLGMLIYSKAQKAVFVRDSVQGGGRKWTRILKFGDASTTHVYAGYGLLNVNDSTLRVDTTIMSTRLWRQKGLDSLTALKVSYADTAAMLLPYLRKGDTASMLLSYLRKGDTLAMLSPYVRGVGFGVIKSGQIIRADTTRSSGLPSYFYVDSLVAAGGGGGLTGSGTADRVARWTGTTALGNSILRDNGTELGINKAPVSGRKLDMTDPAYFQTIVMDGNSTLQFNDWTGGATKGYFFLQNDELIFQSVALGTDGFRINTTNNHTKITFAEAGQVNAGTGTFAAVTGFNEMRLWGQSASSGQINSTIAAISTDATAGINIVAGVTSSGQLANNFIQLGTRGASYAGTDYGTGSNAGNALVVAQGSELTALKMGLFNSIPIYLLTNNTERLTIFGGGNVAIGSTTDNGNGKFQVTGRSTFTDTAALTARFSYTSNIHGSFTPFSLVTKKYADSVAAATGGGDTTALYEPLVAYAGAGGDPDTIGIAGLFALGTAGQMIRINSGATGFEYFSTLGPTAGGTGLTTFTTGDLMYASASNTLAKRAIGSTGDVLTVSGGLPVWAAQSTLTTLPMMPHIGADPDNWVAAVSSTTTLPDLAGAGGSKTVTLPSAASNSGKFIHLWNRNADGTNVWTYAAAITLPDGTTTSTFANGTFSMLYSNGSVWVKMNS